MAVQAGRVSNTAIIVLFLVVKRPTRPGNGFPVFVELDLALLILLEVVVIRHLVILNRIYKYYQVKFVTPAHSHRRSAIIQKDALLGDI